MNAASHRIMPRAIFALVAEALLGQIAIPGENVHRMMGEVATEDAAAAYAELSEFFSLPEITRRASI